LNPEKAQHMARGTKRLIPVLNFARLMNSFSKMMACLKVKIAISGNYCLQNRICLKAPACTCFLDRIFGKNRI